MSAISKLRLKRLSLSFHLSQHRYFQTSPFASQKSSLLDEFTKHCYQADLQSAMKAMDAMSKHNIHTNSITYSQLVKLITARGAVELGRRVQNHIFSNGYRPETFLVNMVVNMFVKFGLLEDAEKVFEEMPARNVVSWTTMVSGYCKGKSHGKALRCLVLMGRDGVRPNVFTYSAVLRACEGLGSVRSLREVHCGIVKVGLGEHEFVRSALIDGYSKLGELGDAVKVFNEVVTGDLVVWNSVIGGFAQDGGGDEALNLFKRMKQAGLVPDRLTLTSVLRACSSLALLELGKQVHVQVVKYDRDLILNNALIDMYCKCGSVDDAYFIFNRMMERDAISWNTMIAGLAQNGRSKEAIKMFQSMRDSGIKPDNLTFLSLLFSCSHTGLLESGWYYFQSMKKLGISPGKEHYNCMIDLLGRAGKLGEAIDLIDEMKCEPDIVIWRTLLGACRVHKNVDLAIYAAKKVLKLDPQDAGTYILLSNVYANSQRWDDVAEVRRTMRALGVKKELAASWIEVNKRIHAFILRDISHPQIDEINQQLDQLILRLKEVGYVPDTNFVLKDLEGEQSEESIRYHSEKLAITFGLMNLPSEMTIRIQKNLRICGDCHIFAKLVSDIEHRTIVIRDPIRYHHFQKGVCSCGDYW